jgi:hypothetical protein
MTDTAFRELQSGIARTFQDERVMTVAVESMLTAEPLVDDHRLIESPRELQRDIQRRILVTADCMVHPIDDELSLEALPRFAGVSQDPNTLG